MEDINREKNENTRKGDNEKEHNKGRQKERGKEGSIWREQEKG